MRRKWTQEDKEYLVENWGYMPLRGIARVLKRSISAIKRMAKKMKLPKRVQSINLTVNRFSNTMGVDNKTVIRWIEQFNLSVEIEKINSTKRFIYIRQDLLMDWLYNNMDIYNGKKINTSELEYIPEWLEEKIKRDTGDNFQRQWTTLEVARLKKYLSNCMSIKKINIFFNYRSYSSITSKVTAMRKKGEIPRREGFKLSSNEKEFINILLEENTLYEVAIITERSEESIRYIKDVTKEYVI